MSSELVPTASLILDPANARKHSKKNLEAIKGSLARFGQQKPIVVSQDNVVIAGNGTLEAARALGWADIEVMRSSLTGSDITAYAIADNRSAELAEWDLDILPGALKALGEEFDLGEIGFDAKDLSRIIATELEPGQIPDDLIPEAAEHVQRGDLWILGEHRLLCGDSSDVLLLERLLDGQKADLLFTDPPYGMGKVRSRKTNAQTEAKGKMDRINTAMNKKSKTLNFILEFNPQAFLSTLPVLFDQQKMNAYIFCDKTLLPVYLNHAVDAEYSYDVLVWKKPNAIPLGGAHRPDLEYLIFYRKSSIWNTGLPGVSYSKCLEFGITQPKQMAELGDHPTIKPVALVVNKVLISSNPGSIVADLFLGTGTTLIACEKTGRRCFGMELEPKYCDVIIKRWEQFTGRTAILSAQGETVDA